MQDSAVQAASRANRPMAFAEGSDAAVVEIVESEREASATGIRWKLKLKITDDLTTGNWMEAAVMGYSADQIAELRARWILLDEEPVSLQGLEVDPEYLNRMLLHVHAKGVQVPMQVERGVIPELAESVDPNGPNFLQWARLYAVLLLRASDAVGSIEYLGLERQGSDAIQVEFRGRRRNKYTNQDPPIITVSGICPIRRAAV